MSDHMVKIAAVSASIIIETHDDNAARRHRVISFVVARSSHKFEVVAVTGCVCV